MEDKNLFTEYQFGSRPGRFYLDPIMIEELQNEINRVTRKSFIKTNLDAQACYDRMIPSLTSIVSQKYGMDSKICAVQSKTLEAARYHMKTQLGMTDKSYTHSTNFPIYGTGQGSGSSPVLWITINSWLFDEHKKISPGVYLATPDNKLKNQI